MRSEPFDIEKINELLAEDRIEAAIDVLLENLKTVVDKANSVLSTGQSVLNSGLSFLIPPEIRQNINEFRNTVTILSASIKRIERDFRSQIIEWSTRHVFRNKVINSLNLLLDDLEKFNDRYGQLFPSKREMLPSPGEPDFLEKARIYISLIKSLSREIEKFADIEIFE